jgi:hypothetical protein
MATVDYLLLANHVEVQNGLLYVSGGGWANLFRGPIDPTAELTPNHFGIGISLLIPWDETNQIHNLVIRIESQSGQEVFRLEGNIEVGRPPGLPSGTDQRIAVGFGIDAVFPEAGSHRAVAQIGENERSVPFQVWNEPKPPHLP